MTLSLEILSPTKTLARETSVDEIIVPALNGQMDILPQHTDLVTTLTTGDIHYRVGTIKKTITISSGILCIENQKVTATVEN